MANGLIRPLSDQAVFVSGLKSAHKKSQRNAGFFIA